MEERARHDQRGGQRHDPAHVVRRPRPQPVDDRPTGRERDREGDQRRGLDGTRHAAPHVVRGPPLEQPLLRDAREPLEDALHDHQAERHDPHGRPSDRQHDHAPHEDGDEQRARLSRCGEPPSREHRPQGRPAPPQRRDQPVPERVLAEAERVRELGHEDQSHTEQEHGPPDQDRAKHPVAHHVAETRTDPRVLTLRHPLVVEPAGGGADQPGGHEERRGVDPEHDRAGGEQLISGRAIAREPYDQLRPEQRADEAAEVPADRHLPVRPREVLLLDQVRDRRTGHGPHRRLQDRRDGGDRHELAGGPRERQGDEPPCGGDVGDHEHPPPIEPVAEPAGEWLHETLQAHREQERHGQPDGRIPGQAVDDVRERRERRPAPRQGDPARHRDSAYRSAPRALHHEGKNHTVARSPVVGCCTTAPGPVALPWSPSFLSLRSGRRTTVAPTANTPAIT